MSEREKLQNDLATFIRELGYNAPYGIIPSIKTLSGGGKARELTFGMARTLDAYLIIFSPKNMAMRTNGPLSRYFQDDYNSVDELKQDLARAVGKE